MRVHVVDPPAYTPPYDHALSAALAAAGAQVTLVTSAFPYGEVPRGDGYVLDERFYRRTYGTAGGALRRLTRLAAHVPEMLAYRRAADAAADVVHLQWLALPQLDERLLPRRPLVLTAHDVLPREPRPGQLAAQRRLYDRADAVVVLSEHGRERLVGEVRVDPAKVEVIAHGVLDDLTGVPPASLPGDFAAVDVPVVLCFGLMRPYKGLDVLVEAWRGITGAELWIVGRPRMDASALQAAAPPGVRFVTRFVGGAEAAAFFRRADLVVLPYREIEGSGVLATALAFASPLLLTDVGSFGEVAATGAAELVAPGDAGALHDALARLVADPDRRAALAAAARAAAEGPYAWGPIAARHLALYERLLG
jgi:glycosyltransferase involved in cell wall biosynthesis